MTGRTCLPGCWNQHFNKAKYKQIMKQSTIDAVASKAALAYKVKQSFIGRNYYIFYGVCVVYVAAALWSMLTAWGNFYLRSAGMFGEGFAAMLAATLGAVALIGLQLLCGKTAVDDWQIQILKRGNDGEHIHAASARAFFFLKCAGFVATTAISVGNSMSGAQLGNEYFRHEKNPPEMEVADVSFFDDQIARLSDNIAIERNRKWKGVLVGDASKRIAEYEAKQEKLRGERAAVIAAVNARNAAAGAAYRAKTESNGSALRNYTGVNEILILFCICFIGLYDDGLYRESRAKGKSGSPSAPPVGFRGAMATAEKSATDTPTMSATAMPVFDCPKFDLPRNQAQPEPAQEYRAIGFHSTPRNATNTPVPVAPAQPSATEKKRNQSATKGGKKAQPKEVLSAQSAARNAQSKIKKAQREFEENAIDADTLAAIILRQQANIDRNQKRISELKRRVK
jgi:hypothetical protein